MFKRIRQMMKDEKGQALSEYGLILALIAVGAIAGLTLLGTNVTTTLGNVAAAL
jgi:pilus assembly protein Flp/PilA